MMAERTLRDLTIGHDYLSCSVYRDADGHDSTNGGVSSKNHTLYLVGEHVTVAEAEKFCKKFPAPLDINNILTVVKRNIGGHACQAKFYFC